MMRLCEILASAEDGGLENHFVDLVNVLVNKHEVHVIAHPRFADRFDKAVHFHPLDLSGSRKNPVTLYQLYRTVRVIQPDLLHAHASKATAMVATIKGFLGCPCVATVHGIKRTFRAIEAMDAVIGVSHGVLDSINNSNKKVIYNGITDFSQVSSEPDIIERLLTDSTLPKVFAVGRLVPVKGFDVLLKAWQGVDANLIIIGDGPEMKALEAQRSALGLTNRVFFTGTIDKAGAFLKYADLLVISSFREGFNYVMAEALQQSVPIVSTDVSGPNEILPKHYLAPVGDDQALRDLINESLADPDQLNKDFLPLFEWSKEKLTISNMAEETSDFLEEIVRSID